MVTRTKKKILSHDPLEKIGSMDDKSSKQDMSSGKNSVISTKSDGEACMENRVNLGEILTIQEVSEVVNTVRTSFDVGTSITLVGGDLLKVDGAGIQLLCALCKEADIQHIDVQWQSSSEILLSAATQLGVKEYLNLPANT